MKGRRQDKIPRKQFQTTFLAMIPQSHCPLDALTLLHARSSRCEMLLNSISSRPKGDKYQQPLSMPDLALPAPFFRTQTFSPTRTRSETKQPNLQDTHHLISSPAHRFQSLEPGTKKFPPYDYHPSPLGPDGKLENILDCAFSLARCQIPDAIPDGCQMPNVTLMNPTPPASWPMALRQERADDQTRAPVTHHRVHCSVDRGVHINHITGGREEGQGSSCVTDGQAVLSQVLSHVRVYHTRKLRTLGNKSRLLTAGID